MRRGNCYVTCEALYHLLGGKKSGWVPHWVKHEGDTHWYLVHRKKIYHRDRTLFVEEQILDPTRKQFKTEPYYLLGRGSGFLTKKPSKRARALMKRCYGKSKMQPAWAAPARDVRGTRNRRWYR